MVGRRGGAGQDGWSPADDLFDGEGRYDHDGRGRHGFFGRLLGGLLKLALIAVLFVVGYITAPAWMPLVQRHVAPILDPVIGTATVADPASTSDIQTLSEAPAASSSTPAEGANAEMAARVAVLEEQIASLSSSQGASGSEALAGLEERLAAVEAAVAALRSGGGVAPDGEPSAGSEAVAPAVDALSALDARLAVIETRLSEAGEDVGAGSLRLIAVGQLTSAADGERPFSAELSALKTVLGDESDAASLLGRLAEPAVVGAPTHDTLRRRLPDVAAAALVADARPEAEAGLLDRAVARMKSVVTVRRIDPDGSGSLDDLLATATQAMDQDRVGDAVDALSAVEGRAAKSVADWLAAAQRRMTIDDAVAELRALALARPQSGANGGTGGTE